MRRQTVSVMLTITLCLAVSLTHGAPRGGRGGGGQRGGQREGQHGGQRGGGSPGGEWSQRTHSGKQSNGNFNKTHKESDGHGAAAGLAAGKNKSPQMSGKQGAATGATAAKRNSPQYSGKEGAAAGAAAVNRNSPQFSGKEGAAAGATVANRNTPAISGAAGATAGYGAVRGSFHDTNIYGQHWYGDHPNAWTATGWTAGRAWVPATGAAVAGYCGYAGAAPISYNYGENVTAQDGNVMVNGQNVGTTAEYSQQAFDLAATGSNAEAMDTDEWLPLGVFAMVRNERQHPQLILQFAINKQGILRGNFTDEVTEHVLPINGAVDKDTQRAAWTVGDNKQTVMEAGINDLTEDEAPALIHKNGKTDHWILVRLPQPKQTSDNSGGKQ